jgi:hypothetical protein
LSSAAVRRGGAAKGLGVGCRQRREKREERRGEERRGEGGDMG